MASSCTYYLTKCGSTSLCDQTMAYRARTDRRTDTRHTDRQKKKTERPKILSNDIFYFNGSIMN